MASYPDFVKQLKQLHLKKKGNKPKVSPNKFYPYGAEAQITELLKGELDDYAVKLSRAALEGGVEAIYGVLGAPPDSFRGEVERISREIDNFQVKAFASFSELVVGERYFPSSDEKEVILRTWQENFVNLCKSTNEEMRKRSAGIISDGVLNGRNMKELVKELQNNCADFSRSKAELIATTEVGKLNTAMNRAQSQSAGIDYYEWAAAMDGRTRESHALMDGKICAWGKDDVYYEWETDEKGKRNLVEKPRPKNAYHGAPGTDFRCRCVALPYVPEYEDDYEEERPNGPVRGVVQGSGEGAIPQNVIKDRNKVNNGLVESFKVAKEKFPKSIFRKIDKDGAIWVDENRLFKVLADTDKPRKDGDEVDKFTKETEMAKIMKRYGHGSILVEEKSLNGEKTPDAIVDGEVSEFKQIDGKIGRVEDNLKKAMSQGANIICMNIKRDFSLNSVAEIIKKRIRGKNNLTVFFYLSGKLYKMKTKKAEI